jgi:hypothetical protein
MTMKMTIKAMITIATPNMNPSISRVGLEDEYDPYLQ